MTSSVSKTPSILWSQTKSQVTLVIEAPDVKQPKIDITEKSIKFDGSDGVTNYSFEFPFFSDVVAEGYECVEGARNWVIKLKKAEKEAENDKQEVSWKSLNSGKKLPFIKVDWTRWVDDDESEEDDFMNNMGMGKGWDADGDMGDLGGLGGGDSDDDDELEDLPIPKHDQDGGEQPKEEVKKEGEEPEIA